MAWWIFQNLVTTTVLAAAVALACRAGRIGPVARHALWVLVLVKFITPPLVVWPWAAPDPFRLAALDVSVTDAQNQRFDRPPMAAEATVIESTPGLPLAAEPRPYAASDAAASVWPSLLGIWFLGGLCLVAIEAARIARLSRRISNSPPDPAIVARVAMLSAHLGLRRAPVLVVAEITSPVVRALGRPRILWPSNLGQHLGNDLTDACVDGILVHELAHIKRRDHLIGWIELAAGVVWWWNPLFWSVRSALREQAELACDAWVISALPNGRRAYAESLLALSGATLLNPSMAAVGIRPASRRVLERRLVMIMQGQTSLRLPWVGLGSLALVAAATLPAWASAPQQPPPPPPVVVRQVPRQSPPPPRAVRAPLPPTVVLSQPRPVLRGRRQEVEKAPSAPTLVQAAPTPRFRTFSARKDALPADGQQLLEGFEADTRAIQEEANQKTEARRAAAIKALEALQDRYTKDGKLDEAIAIRDYLRAGGPGTGPGRYVYAIKR
ncbi:MAG TPA: M56 family metallopeptidase [Vicinamibacterales bacterium]|nr:M56 family metallopeptidase [Vicinamibacterales bacterium]